MLAHSDKCQCPACIHKNPPSPHVEANWYPASPYSWYTLVELEYEVDKVYRSGHVLGTWYVVRKYHNPKSKYHGKIDRMMLAVWNGQCEKKTPKGKRVK